MNILAFFLIEEWYHFHACWVDLKMMVSLAWLLETILNHYVYLILVKSYLKPTKHSTLTVVVEVQGCPGGCLINVCAWRTSARVGASPPPSSVCRVLECLMEKASIARTHQHDPPRPPPAALLLTPSHFSLVRAKAGLMDMCTWSVTSTSHKLYNSSLRSTGGWFCDSSSRAGKREEGNFCFSAEVNTQCRHKLSHGPETQHWHVVIAFTVVDGL